MNQTNIHIKIGLENHLKLKLDEKLFCRCLNNSEARENTLTCIICLGFPGALPQVNFEAIQLALRLAHHFKCVINLPVIFERKHYSYPDMPKLYQITQESFPIGTQGNISIGTSIGTSNVYISKLAIEEDAAKIINNNDGILLDFNRAGTPLIELCTEPCFSNVEDVLTYLKLLKDIAIVENIIDNHSSSVRCDVNISINGNNRVELKNLNSITSIQSGLEFEINRQTQLILEGKEITRETRGWNRTSLETYSMRKKEDLNEYMFIPEFDIPPMYISKKFIDDLALRDCLDVYNNFSNKINNNERKNKLFHLIFKSLTFNNIIHHIPEEDINYYIDIIYDHPSILNLEITFIKDLVLILKNKEIDYKVLKNVLDDIHNGKTLSNAISSYKAIYPDKNIIVDIVKTLVTKIKEKDAIKTKAKIISELVKTLKQKEPLYKIDIELINEILDEENI